MEKTFEVCGTAKCVLIFRGMAVQPKQQFRFQMTENEYNCFKQYMDIIYCNDILPDRPQKSEQPEEKPIEQAKGEVQNVRRTSTNSARNKRQSSK